MSIPAPAAPAPPPPAKLLRWQSSAPRQALLRLAANALTRYDVRVRTLAPLAMHQNMMFRLVLEDGRRFVVRVNMPGMRTPLDIASEMAWLAALRRDTDLVVPEPLPARDGALMTIAEAPGVPEPRAVSVFAWIDGRTVGDTIGAPTARAMGALLGRLQDHADRFVPPPVFTASRFNNVWGFGGHPSAIFEGALGELWTPARRGAIERAAARGQARIDALHADPAALRFLHIDLHSANVMRIPGGLAALDFDDARWAHPEQDTGIPLFYFWVRKDGDRLVDAFLEGHAAARGDGRFDRRTIATHIAARQVDLLSFILKKELLPASDLPGYLEKVDSRLARLEALAGRG